MPQTQLQDFWHIVQNKVGLNMKKTFKLLLSLFILISIYACTKTPQQTVILGQTKTKIEVFSSYNPLELVKNVTNEEYEITVINDEIDKDKLGSYQVTYEVTSSKNKKSQIVFTFEVVDTKPPELVVNKEIEVNVDDTSWKITDFASAKDEYDGDLADKIIIDGDYDITTAGEYRITLRISDSSNNTSSRVATIYVNNNAVSSQPGLYGTYMVNYSEATANNPTLILESNMTFTLKFNYCAGFQTFAGSFTQNGNKLTLESDGFNFGDNPSDNTVTMQINNDGSLTYLDDYSACSPVKNDVFKKR